MKVTMDSSGVITLKPENSLEAFALRQWVDKALVVTADMGKAERALWLASMLVVDANLPEPPPTTEFRR